MAAATDADVHFVVVWFFPLPMPYNSLRMRFWFKALTHSHTVEPTELQFEQTEKKLLEINDYMHYKQQLKRKIGQRMECKWKEKTAPPIDLQMTQILHEINNMPKAL